MLDPETGREVVSTTAAHGRAVHRIALPNPAPNGSAVKRPALLLLLLWLLLLVVVVVFVVVVDAVVVVVVVLVVMSPSILPHLMRRQAPFFEQESLPVVVVLASAHGAGRCRARAWGAGCRARGRRAGRVRCS